MPPIGETLREARMRQKLDIADVEERTKIRAKYLRALENEEWSLLPGPTFVKTFLRTYAEVVGVDAHLLVEEYRTSHEPADPHEMQPITAAASRRSAGRGRRPAPTGPPSRLPLVLAAAAAIVIFLAVLGLTGGDDGGKGSPNAARTTPTRTETVRTAPAPEPRPKPSGVRVRIAPDGPTYVCVDYGDGTPTVFEGTLETPRTFRNAKEVRLNLGRRSGTITANGKRVQVQPSSEPLGLRVTRSETKEIAQGTRPCA